VYGVHMRRIALALCVFSLLPAVAQGDVETQSYVQNRPQQAQCRASPYFQSSFAITDAGVATPTDYCHPETGLVPNTYQQPRQQVHAQTRYSLWAVLSPLSSTATPTMDSPCTQQAKANLCTKIHETPLFVVSPSNSEYECRCDEGYFKSDIGGNRECVACPDNAFCPLHTNRFFHCPSNSQLIVHSASSGAMVATGMQRLVDLGIEAAYCKAQQGYVLRHAHRDLTALILACLSADDVHFYTAAMCRKDCFRRVLCDYTPLETKFLTLCAPGEFSESEFPRQTITTFSQHGECTICPVNSFCMGGVRYLCQALQYTVGVGHDSETACQCGAGSYKAPRNDDTTAAGCIKISTPDYYSRACLTPTDKTCGIRLPCPRESLCEDGILTVQCRGGEIMHHGLQKCVSCPVGFYCVDGVSMQQCPPGSTTSFTRSIDSTDCFCVVPFVATPVAGTAQGFVCQMTMLDLPNTTIQSISVNGGRSHEQTQLTVDAGYSKLRLEHRPAGAITHTIMVLNSSSSSIVVHLFVNDVAGVRIVSSNLTLVSTAVAETLQLFNTVLLVGSVDFTEAGETGAVTLLVMLMDTLQGLVYHGVLETRLHADTHHLSLYSQDWNQLFQFGNMVFYTTLSVPSHYSFAACQTRNSAVVAAEQLLLGTGNEDPLVDNHYDMIRFDLLRADITITSFKSAVPLDTQNPPVLSMDRTRQFISFRDPLVPNDIIRLDFATWQPSASIPATLPSISPHTPHFQTHVSGVEWDYNTVMLLPSTLVAYKGLFHGASVLAQHTNGIVLEIVKLEFKTCLHGTQASADSFFQCVCRPGYKLEPAERKKQGDGACVECSLLESCVSEYAAASNASKCSAGYKLYRSHCVLCGANEYCFHGQGHACPLNSWTAGVKGAVDSLTCVCKPGYYRVAATNSAPVACQPCARPFYCSDSVQYECPQHMGTNVPKAHSYALCECQEGFFQHNVSGAAQCREVPIGYFTDSVRKELVQCPASTTTYGTGSVSKTQCVCAGGFKSKTVLDTVVCEPCTRDEMCSTALRGAVGQCIRYKQIVNQKNDACVCEAGFYDAMATQLGAMQCIACPAGFYCPQERNTKVLPTIHKCPYSTTSHPGTPSEAGCFCQQSDRNLMASPVPPFALQCLCPSSHYETGSNGACTPCPLNMFVSIQSMLFTTKRQSPLCSCVSGFYPTSVLSGDNTGAMECAICPVGHYCTAGQTDTGPVACPYGTFGPAIGQTNERGCLQCPVAAVVVEKNEDSQQIDPQSHTNHSYKNKTTNTNVASIYSVERQSALSPRALQGGVLDCFSSYTPIYTSRELDLELCSFVFVILSNRVRKQELIAGLDRIFNHRLASVDVVSSLGRIQFSVTLSAEFSVAILLAMSRIDAIWAIIRAGSLQNPTMYVSVLRYIFCDTVQQIANDIYGNNVDISVCYMPMDRMTTIGVTC